MLCSMIKNDSHPYELPDEWDELVVEDHPEKGLNSSRTELDNSFGPPIGCLAS